MDRNSANETLEDSTLIWKRRRYFVVFMAFLGYFNIFTMRSNLSVAIVSMTRNHSIINNDGEITYEQNFSWDSKEKGYVLSSFYYGYICTQILGGALSTVIGGNILFGTGVLMTSILTLVAPIAANIHLYVFIASRAFIGIFEGITIPALYQMWFKWVPPRERARLFSIAHSGGYIGLVVSTSLSGVIISSIGWEFSFYIFGIFGLIWSILWLIFIGQSPAKDHFISLNERNFIEESLRRDLKCIANFAAGYGIYTLQTQLPQFVYDTLNYNITESGFISALPYLFLAFMVLLAGTLTDWVIFKGHLTKLQTRKIFACFSLLINMICVFLAVYFVHPIASIAFITIGLSITAFAIVNADPNLFDLAPQFSGVLVAIANSSATISGMISPVVSGFIVTDGTEQQWKIVFYISAALYFVGALVFGIWSEAEIQPWAKEKENENREQ
ncbi:hypothetical protein PVAND_009967 [Polypedilum vanderplanki]|uniref:Sialin n=1 Tax=Polypedilum vanderplanki TaxID=319348 RepID=A0A9J6CFA2_POLVA|nr:hypothetical protein PVAND_009967 [Polypedilum vanderplanki]